MSVQTETPAPSTLRRRSQRADGRVPARKRRRIPLWVYAVRVAILVTLVVGWELSAREAWIDDFFTSRPSEIWDSWWTMVTSGELRFNFVSTFQSYLTGFALGGLAALVLGYVIGSSRNLAMVLEPFITGVYSIPKLALIPLFVMWFGIGRQLEVVICALVVFFVMFFNTFFGIRDVDRGLVDAMRLMGGSRVDIALRVKLPSALVWVVAGLKISVPQGLIAVVVAEMLASNKGLGHLVAFNAGQFNSSGTFAAIFTLLIIGLAIDRLVAAFTARALAWKEDVRAA